MQKEDRYSRAKKILKCSKYAAGGKVTKESSDGEADMEPQGKHKGGKIAKEAHGKKPKHRADKKHRG
jgi:hypothetical protein